MLRKAPPAFILLLVGLCYGAGIATSICSSLAPTEQLQTLMIVLVMVLYVSGMGLMRFAVDSGALIELQNIQNKNTRNKKLKEEQNER